MINQAVFEQMKTGVVIICAARGGVIDEKALLEALESGKVVGAALDVFATEPPGDSSLVCHPRVVCTPHIGAQTNEAQQQAAVDIAHEMLNALEGRPLRWKVA
jgi:D-3-phosphoglycerate dehydrogenase